MCAYIGIETNNNVTTKTMTNSQRKATDSMIHRIAQAKKEYGAENADSYKKASDRIKKERG